MEVIVVHDREEADPSLARLSCAGRRVVSMVNTRTGGLCGARNTGVLASRGAFVASCDDDDLWYPAKVRLQVERLLADPSLLAVGAGIRLLMGERGNVDVAGPRSRHQPRAAAGEPGQGAAQLDADDAPLRLRRGGAVRRGAAARLRRGLRLAAAGQPGGLGRSGPGDPGRHPQGRPLLVQGPLAQHRHGAGVPARQAPRLPGPPTRSRPDPGPDRLRSAPPPANARRGARIAGRALRRYPGATARVARARGGRTGDRARTAAWRAARRLGRGLS